MDALSGTAFSAFVLVITLKSLLLAGAVLLITWFMRRSSAAQRHLYLSVAVFALLLLPMASVVLPSWNVDLLPHSFGPSGEAFISAAGPVGTPDPISAADREPSARLDAGDNSANYSGGETGGAWRIYPWLLLVWIAGACVLLGRLLGGKLYGHWIAKRASEMEDDRVLDAVKRVSQKLGYVREIRVAESDRLNVPFVCGLIRPGLVIPSQVKRWPVERIEVILHHEFAHIKRKDILLQFFAQMACCLYWLNPLAWVLERKLFIERERACDDIAITRDIKASDYAGYLMEAMEELGDRRNPVWVMSAMAEGTDFKDRIISVLDPVAKRTAPRIGHRSGVAVLSMLLLLPFSSLHPWAVGQPAVGGDVAAVVESKTGAGTQTSSSREAVPRDDGELAAAEARGGITEGGRDQQADALIALLDSPIANMRKHAATALGEAGKREAVSALIEALNDEDSSVREHVATALGNIGDRRAALPLAGTVTDDPRARVREHAAIALGMIGDEKALSGLIEAVRADPEARVREHAATALGMIGDERALSGLIEAVRADPEARVREHAATAIGMVGGEGAFEVLVRSYKNDRDARVRAHAAYGLGHLGDDRAFDLLVEGLGSRHSEIRAHCAGALGLLGDRRAVAYLKKLLRDPSQQVRELARNALTMLGE
ncbi:MAG: HEAT repeat domain-containing protein [bacterium]|nr:MAG: HEAT repeat domain-containing protein [bacterium]